MSFSRVAVCNREYSVRMSKGKFLGVSGVNNWPKRRSAGRETTHKLWRGPNWCHSYGTEETRTYYSRTEDCINRLHKGLGLNVPCAAAQVAFPAVSVADQERANVRPPNPSLCVGNGYVIEITDLVCLRSHVFHTVGLSTSASF